MAEVAQDEAAVQTQRVFLQKYSTGQWNDLTMSSKQSGKLREELKELLKDTEKLLLKTVYGSKYEHGPEVPALTDEQRGDAIAFLITNIFDKKTKGSHNGTSVAQRKQNVDNLQSVVEKVPVKVAEAYRQEGMEKMRSSFTPERASTLVLANNISLKDIEALKQGDEHGAFAVSQRAVQSEVNDWKDEQEHR